MPSKKIQLRTRIYSSKKKFIDIKIRPHIIRLHYNLKNIIMYCIYNYIQISILFLFFLCQIYKVIIENLVTVSTNEDKNSNGDACLEGVFM